MATVSVKRLLEGTVHEAETCWYDTQRWPAWVDSLARVVAVHGEWPQVGASVTWESGPAGRGTVRERVTAYEPLAGQTVAVEDDSITGTQSVAFTPAGREVEVELVLRYSIKRRSVLTPVVDVLFVKRPMTFSLTKTLTRFAVVLAESRQAGVG